MQGMLTALDVLERSNSLTDGQFLQFWNRLWRLQSMDFMELERILKGVKLVELMDWDEKICSGVTPITNLGKGDSALRKENVFRTVCEYYIEKYLKEAEEAPAE